MASAVEDVSPLTPLNNADQHDARYVDVQAQNTFNQSDHEQDDHSNKRQCLNVFSLVFTVFCWATVAYGFYAVIELWHEWSRFTPKQIDSQCNGHYYEEFRGGALGPRGVPFRSMYWLTIILMSCYGFILALTIRDKVDRSTRSVMIPWANLAVDAIVTITWLCFCIALFQFYHRVMDYCDEGTPLYQGIMRIFDWLYPIVIYEFVKGGVACFALCIGSIYFFC